MPDFFDGHHHVHLLPQINAALIDVIRVAAPTAWVRQCGRNAPLLPRLADRKGLLLDLFSYGLRRRASAAGVRMNTAFAGTYDLNEGAQFASLFPGFLALLTEGGVIMCHPGLVDAELQRLDSLTTLREQEYAYLASDAFPIMLAENAVSLAAPIAPGAA